MQPSTPEINGLSSHIAGHGADEGDVREPQEIARPVPLPVNEDERQYGQRVGDLEPVRDREHARDCRTSGSLYWSRSTPGSAKKLPRSHRGRATPGGLLLAAILALGWNTAAGDAAFELVLAEAQGNGWHAVGVTISLARDAGGRLSADLRAAQLVLPEPVGVLENVGGACTDLVITSRSFTCRRLALAAAPGQPRRPGPGGRVEYRRDTGALHWELATAQAAQGSLSFAGSLAGEGWTARLSATGWPAADLAELAGMVMQGVPELDGGLDLSLTARGTLESLLGLVFEIRGAGVAVANDSGTLATEGLEFALSGSAWQEETGPRVRRTRRHHRGARPTWNRSM
jgi:hypothetical protein